MAVAIVLDALICIIALLALISGLRRGFVWICFRKFRKVTAGVVSLLLAKPLGYWFSKLFISNWLTKLIMSWAKLEDAPAASPDEMVEQLPKLVRAVAGWFGMDVQAIATDAYNGGEGMYYHFIREASLPMARFLGVILAWVALFIASLILLRILLSVGTSLTELPVLKQLNALLGACMSLLLWGAAVWIAVKLLVWISGLAPVASLSFMQSFTLDQTYITKYIYHFNPLAFILSL